MAQTPLHCVFPVFLQMLLQLRLKYARQRICQGTDKKESVVWKILLLNTIIKY